MKRCSSEHSLHSRRIAKNEWVHSPTHRVSTTLQFLFRAVHYRQLSRRYQCYGVLRCDALRSGKFSQQFGKTCCMHIHGGNLSAREK